jgi:alanine-synthesizing transaminase
MPDLDELRNKVKYNDSIAGLMIINPDNPTGAVYPREIVQQMVALAKEFDLFIVADEIYTNMVYDQDDYVPLSDVIDDVPALSLKGISKEVPWPGSRCGWIEVYNQERSATFRRYVKSILDAKMLEVCSTTLPQMVIPSILGDARYPEWQVQRNAQFARRARQTVEYFADCPGVIVNRPHGAFYLSVVFSGPLSDRMHLVIENQRVAAYISELCPPGVEPDRRFVYELLGAHNICVVPLSGFMCDLPGFRSTLLEQDDARFEHIYGTIAQAVREFIASG